MVSDEPQYIAYDRMTHIGRFIREYVGDVANLDPPLGTLDRDFDLNQPDGIDAQPSQRRRAGDAGDVERPRHFLPDDNSSQGRRQDHRRPE